MSYNHLFVAGLRQELASRQLDTSGLKAVMVERLEQNDMETQQQAAFDDTPVAGTGTPAAANNPRTPDTQKLTNPGTITDKIVRNPIQSILLFAAFLFASILLYANYSSMVQNQSSQLELTKQVPDLIHQLAKQREQSPECNEYMRNQAIVSSTNEAGSKTGQSKNDDAATMTPKWLINIGKQLFSATEHGTSVTANHVCGTAALLDSITESAMKDMALQNLNTCANQNLVWFGNEKSVQTCTVYQNKVQQVHKNAMDRLKFVLTTDNELKQLTQQQTMVAVNDKRTHAANLNKVKFEQDTKRRAVESKDKKERHASETKQKIEKTRNRHEYKLKVKEHELKVKEHESKTKMKESEVKLKAQEVKLKAQEVKLWEEKNKWERVKKKEGLK